MPKAVAADRGYGEAKVDADLAALGVKTIAIPRKGRPGAARQAIERGRRFRRLVKWRTGSEGRVACLKRDAGLARTLMDGLGGTQTWCGWGILTQNSIKIARLIDTAAPSASVGRTRPPATAGASPPTPRSDISRPAA